MSAAPHPRENEAIDTGRQVIRSLANYLNILSTSLSVPFGEAVDLLDQCATKIILSGIGKSGHIAQKVAATFGSTNRRALFLHPAEAAHGDLGHIGPLDPLLIFSKSGASAELSVLTDHVNQWGSGRIIAVTAQPLSPLAKAASIVLPIPDCTEVAPHGLPPVNSAGMMLALGDALAVALMQRRGVERETLARLHPAGALGEKLRA